MFLNISNHPSLDWSDKQFKATNNYGRIIDIPLDREIDPNWSSDELEAECRRYFNLAMDCLYDDNGEYIDKSNAIHVDGPADFVYGLVSLLKHNNELVVKATSKRINIPLSKDSKISRFDFIQFREYPNFR